MTFTQWALVVWIALSGLASFAKGFARKTQTYSPATAIIGLIECGIALWAVTTL